MSWNSFACVGPGKWLAYLRADLRSATKSLFVISPWLDEDVAKELVLLAPPNLTVRVLVRSEDEIDPKDWQDSCAAFVVMMRVWQDFEARTLQRLNARCLFIDDCVAYVGSAILSRRELERNLDIVARGPVAEVIALREECETLWAKATPLPVTQFAAPKRAHATNSDHKKDTTDGFLDPLAAKVLQENPKAFVLGKKKQRH